MLLIDQLGMEGYGIFWILIEVLRIEPEMKYQLALLPILARRYNTSAEKMLAVVSKYDLFKVENNEFFFSESLQKRIFEKSELSRKAAQVRWEADKRELYERNADALQPDYGRIADGMPNKIKKNKVKKNKEDISIIAPISDEISQTRTPLQIFIKEKCPNISKMKNQLTNEEAQRLIDDYSKEDIKLILAEMENYKLLAIKNISVNLTARKWLRMKEERNARK
jgi:hypothetical protein